LGAFTEKTILTEIRQVDKASQAERFPLLQGINRESVATKIKKEKGGARQKRKKSGVYGCVSERHPPENILDQKNQ